MVYQTYKASPGRQAGYGKMSYRRSRRSKRNTMGPRRRRSGMKRRGRRMRRHSGIRGISHHHITERLMHRFSPALLTQIYTKQATHKIYQ